MTVRNKSKQFAAWQIGNFISIAMLIVFALGSAFIFSEDTVLEVIKLSAKFGMFALAIMFAIKNIALAHKKGTNQCVDFLRKQLRWQREQGLIAFHAFVLHALATIMLYIIRLQMHIGFVMYMLFTAIVPTVLMLYLYMTSFKPIQKRVKGWKKSHTLGWLLFGSVIAHEILLNQTLSLTTIAATILAIGTLLYGFFIDLANKRSKKQLIIAGSGFVVLAMMFFIESIIGKSIQGIGEQISDSTSNENQTTLTPQVTSELQKYKDGTYTGVGVGYGGELEVNVTVTNGKIMNIVVGKHNETKYFSNAYPAIPNEIITQQSPQVNAVSGATRSSEGIMDAVAAALVKAM